MKRICWNWLVIVFILCNENCFHVIANEFECYVCSSDKLEACSITKQSNETELPIQSCSSSSCFLKIENGITYRDCMPTNADGASPNSNGCDNKTCTSCQSSKCNGHSLKLDNPTKKCMVCDSKDDATCVSELTAKHSKECKNADDQCFTHIEQSNIKRGCLSGQSSDFPSICQKNGEKCSICKENDCNNQKIVLETCIDCDSANDEKCQQKLNSHKGKICSTLTSKESLGCFLSTEPKAKWGCVRDLEPKLKEQCVAQVDNCKTCNGNDCNSMKQFQSCYYNNTAAESSSTASLASNDDQNKGTTVCKKFDDKCFTLITEKDVIVKECLFDYAEERNISVDFLKKYKKSSYDTCSTPLCNNLEIRPMHCIACDSTKDKNCNTMPLAKAIKCPLEINFSGCYHRTDGQNTQRGCIAELNEEMKLNCKSDSDECKKCVGNECNSRLFFQKCITENSKSDDPKISKLCKRYSDECFIHVDNSSVVRKGCKSDVLESPEKEIDLEADCRNATKCEICSSKNDCNSRTVWNELCIDCRSKISGTCADPHKMNPRPKKCPLALKAQGCYLMRNSDTVQRGCASHLDKHDRNNCSAGNDTCKICFGDECNLKKEFQTCYSCKSANEKDKCIDSPEESKQITCPNYMDHCYTAVRNEAVMRGCTGDKVVPSIDKCTDDSENCKHCSADGPCNTEKIQPITCITCDSLVDPTCATNVTFDSIKICPAYLHTQRCYHFINKTSAQHIRGCLADLQEPIKSLCKKGNNSDECRTCAGSDCNKKLAFARCLHCDSALNPECAINPDAKLFNKVCDFYEDDKCYTNISKYNVTRGCLMEQKKSFVDDVCTNSRKCAICPATHELGCNNQTFVMETCVDCDTKNGDNCYDDLDKFKGKVCSDLYSTEKEGCFLRIEEKQTKRGCVRDLTDSEKEDCNDKSDTCKTCQGKDCNFKRTFQQCIQCNSKYNNGCLGNKTDTWSLCENYLSTCITGIDAHGYTHRRCSIDYEHDSLVFPNKQSKVCTPNKCNNDIFPEDRLQCYVCDGERDCDFMPTNSPKPLPMADRELKPCNIFSVYDQCYAFFTKNEHVYRGCLSDSSDHRLLCDQEQKKNNSCITCEKSGCNDTPKIRPATLSCIQCRGSHECAFGFERDAATKCKTAVRLGLEESCYVYYRNDKNGSIERGCTLDRKRKPSERYKIVHVCKQSGCNRKNKVYSKCILCDSRRDDKCNELPDPKVFTKQCYGIYAYDKRGCYTLKQNDTVIRGCIKDLAAAEREICQKEKDKCHICLDKDGCNTIIPGKSANLCSNGLLIALAVSFASFVTLQFNS